MDTKIKLQCTISKPEAYTKCHQSMKFKMRKKLGEDEQDFQKWQHSKKKKSVTFKMVLKD